MSLGAEDYTCGTRSRYERNADGVVARTHGPTQIPASQQLSTRLAQQALQQNSEEHVGSGSGRPGLREPAYQTDDALKAHYANYTERRTDFEEGPNTFNHYGRGLQWNVQQSAADSGTMSKMSRAGGMEADDLFSSFLSECASTGAAPAPSWHMKSHTVQSEPAATPIATEPVVSEE